MKRCVVLLISAAICFAVDAERDAAAVISNLAASLTAGNAQEFLSAFDRAMPGYDKLRANVTALVRVGETQSYIDIARNEGDDRARTIEMTWELRVQREGEAVASRRETRITCKLEKQGKKWRITGMEPVEWLGP
jgi:hypothetical protein